MFTLNNYFLSHEKIYIYIPNLVHGEQKIKDKADFNLGIKKRQIDVYFTKS